MPLPRLETARLTLRLGEVEEAEAVADFHQRNRAHFEPWDPRRAEAFFTAAWWHERLALDHRAAEADQGYRLLLFPREGGRRVIGHVHFSNVVRGAFQACHLGFGIDRAEEGTGRMREALQAALAWAFDELRLHRIEANHRPDNVRSGGLLKRLGFVPQGYARDYLFIDGAWRDHVLTALTNPSWRPPEPG
jgi:ribosomal-protein-alanine N-acetyltransferase